MNGLQRQILALVANLADQFPCIKTIYIFGSVARGEVENAKDVDLSVEYFEDFEKDYTLRESYIPFQSCWDDWALETSELIGKPVRWAHVIKGDRNDPAAAAIALAAQSPVAVRGKAMIVATPRVKNVQ